MLYLMDVADLDNGLCGVPRGVLANLTVIDEDNGVQIFNPPTYKDLNDVCDEHGLVYRDVCDLITEMDESTHSVIFNIVEYKANLKVESDEQSAKMRTKWDELQSKLIEDWTEYCVKELGLPPNVMPFFETP